MSKSNCNQLSTTEQVFQENAVKSLCAFLEKARKARTRVKKVARKGKVGRTLLISRVYQPGVARTSMTAKAYAQHLNAHDWDMSKPVKFKTPNGAEFRQLDCGQSEPVKY